MNHQETALTHNQWKMGVMENAALLRNTPSLELKAEDEGKRGEYLR